jgi:hypothetical protein
VSELIEIKIFAPSEIGAEILVPISFAAVATTSKTGDILMGAVDWGLGEGFQGVNVNQDSGDLSLSHTYPTGGSYSVTVRVRGVSGGEGFTSLVIHVTTKSGSFGGGVAPTPTAIATPSVPSIPGAPPFLIATWIGTGIKFTWQAPDDDGRSPITDYNIFSDPPGYGIAVGGNQTEISVTAPTPGEFQFVVHAKNAVGLGPASPPSGVVSVVQPAPTSLSTGTPTPTTAPTSTATPTPTVTATEVPTPVPTATSVLTPIPTATVVSNVTTFYIGSSSSDVLAAQGTPSKVQVYSYNDTTVWSYGNSSVTFSNSTDRVIEYSDSANNLQLPVRIPDGSTFSIGFSSSDVLAAQGTPSKVQVYSYNDTTVWSYGNSSVTFSNSTDRVIEYSDSANNLNLS